jgi:hypothetical protein
MASQKPDLRQALKPLSNTAAPTAIIEKPEPPAPAARPKSKYYRPSREGM